MLRGVLCNEVVLALVFKPICTIRTQAQQNGAIIDDLFMTKIFELCCLKNKDDNDDDEKPDLTAVFCNSSFSV